MNNYLVFFLILASVLTSCNQTVSITDSSVIKFDVTKEYDLKELEISSIADVEYVLPQSRDSFLFTNFVYLTDNHIVLFNYFEGDFVFLIAKVILRVSYPKWGKVLMKSDLEKADNAGKLSGDLKKIFNRMGDEDPFILMIIKFV